MIKSISIENFFSVREVQKITLNSGVNLLLGINGSGKSNFIKAFYLLSESIKNKDRFSKIFDSWGGFPSIINFSSSPLKYIKLVFEFDKEYLGKLFDSQGFLFPNNPIYEITIHALGNGSAYYISEKVYNEGKAGQNPFVYLDMQNGKGFISERKDGKSRLIWKETEEVKPVKYEQKGETFKEQELVLGQVAADTKRFFPLYTLKEAIESIDVYTYFDTTLESKARQWNKSSSDTQLKTDLINLSSTIQRISAKYPLYYEKIQEAITKVNPFFKSISLDYLGENFRIILTEKHLSKTVSLESISDGTLRFLILLSILYNPEAGGLICLDEPDLGLHPDMIQILAEVLREAVKDGKQLICSTHSPFLLNMFELDDIWIFEKGVDNQTIIKSKSEDEFSTWAGEFLPGKLWLSGLIGGRRWG